MVTSVANVAGGIASVVLSALVLCFNVPRFVAPQGWAGMASTVHGHARNGGITGIRATTTMENVGHGRERITVWLDFGPRDVDEGL